MRKFIEILLALSPYHHHATLDVGMAAVAVAGLALSGGTMAVMASCASFIYFVLMIAKQIAAWYRIRKDKADAAS